MTSTGIPSGVIYGFLTSLRLLCAKFRPNQIICCFDTGISFRSSLLESYKATRTKERTPEEIKSRSILYEQLAVIPSLLNAIGVPCVKRLGLEADDLAALIVYNVPFEGETILVSGDKDWLQLLSQENTKLYSPMITTYGKMIHKGGPELPNDLPREEWKKWWIKQPEVGIDAYTRFVEDLDFPVPFDRWTLYRALTGDKSDNLDGVPGIGPKTAYKICVHTKDLAELKQGYEDGLELGLSEKLNATLKEACATGYLDLQYNLIDLAYTSRQESSKVEIEKIKKVLSTEIPVNHDAFKGFLRKYEIASILTNYNKYLSVYPHMEIA